MSAQRYHFHSTSSISYLSNEQLLFLRKGNRALAMGVKQETKNAYALQAMSMYYNCDIGYKQLKNGKNLIKSADVKVQITLNNSIKMELKAKKQSEKMKIY